MGIRLWAAKKLMSSQGRKLDSDNKTLLKELNAELLSTSNDYKSAIREAETVSKIMHARMHIKKLRDELRDVALAVNDTGEEDFDDEEDDEEEDDDLANIVMKNIIAPAIKAKMNPQDSNLSPQDFAPQEQNPLRARANDALSGLSDKQLKALEKKGLI